MKVFPPRQRDFFRHKKMLRDPKSRSIWIISTAYFALE
jgi:hypothetical protein